jgi:anti-anti-sigma factor
MAGDCYYRLPSAVDVDGSDKLRSELLNLVNAGTGDLIVDCVRLEFIDSIGVAVIAKMRRLLTVHKRTLRLVNLSPRARRPFELLGLGEFFGLGEEESA